MLRTDHQRGRSLRGATPLVEVPRPEVSSQGVDVDRQHPHRVRRVHQDGDASASALPNDLLHGKDHRRRRRHVVDDDQPGAIVERRRDGPHDRVRGWKGERQLNHHELAASFAAGLGGGLHHGRIGMVRDHDPIPRAGRPIGQHGADGGRGIGNEGETLRVGSKERGCRRPGLVERRREHSDQEVDRFALHLGSPPGLGLQRGQDRRAEGAMVEERDGGIQGPQGTHA